MPISTPVTPSPLKIAQAYQGFLDEPVPSDLFDAVVSGKAKSVLQAIKIGFLLLLGYLAAVIVGKITSDEIPSLDQTISIEQLAVGAHTTFAKDAVYPARVESNDIDHLSRWLAYRSDMLITIPQLSTVGFSLLGGNIVPDSGNISVMLVYENTQGSKISVFYRNALFDKASAKPSSGTLGNHHWQSLSNQQANIVLVSELDQTQLQTVSTFMQR